MSKQTFQIAVIAGDGIGKETVPEGGVLKAIEERFDIAFHLTEYDFASADYYVAHGKMLPIIGKKN